MDTSEESDFFNVPKDPAHAGQFLARHVDRRWLAAMVGEYMLQHGWCSEAKRLTPEMRAALRVEKEKRRRNALKKAPGVTP